MVDIHPENIVQQNSFFFTCGEIPVISRSLIDFIVPLFCLAFALGFDVLFIPVSMPIQQILVCIDQERSRTTGRIENSKRSVTLDLACYHHGCFALQQFAHRIFDDVFDYILRCVIDPTSFFNFRFLLDLGLAA
ncbi:MAG: hypothetical protein LDLANPLL_02524 [Turneriella sp.]|nr:hypothetical protein [Turneriella sp.]